MCKMVQKNSSNFVNEELHIFKLSAHLVLGLLPPVQIENRHDLSRKTIIESFESVRELFRSSGKYGQKLNLSKRLQWKQTIFTPQDVIQEVERCFST